MCAGFTAMHYSAQAGTTVTGCEHICSLFMGMGIIGHPIAILNTLQLGFCILARHISSDGSAISSALVLLTLHSYCEPRNQQVIKSIWALIGWLTREKSGKLCRPNICQILLSFISLCKHLHKIWVLICFFFRFFRPSLFSLTLIWKTTRNRLWHWLSVSNQWHHVTT